MISKGFCECGCGERTAIARQTRAKDGIVAGQPNRFIVGHNYTKPVLDGHKQCRGCNIVKSTSEFAPDQRNRDKLQTRCKECKNAYARNHYQLYQKTKRQYFNQYRQEHPEVYRRSGHRRRARVNSAIGDYTPAQLQARIDYYGGKCYMCGCDWYELPSKDRTIDHVIPLSRGGTNWPANLRPMCRSCNAKKWARCVV